MKLWPAKWGRQQRSSASMVLATLALVLILWLCALPLSLLPEPIGSNADSFADGVRTTVELTLIAGLAGLLIGIAAALGKLSRAAAALDGCRLCLGDPWHALADPGAVCLFCVAGDRTILTNERFRLGVRSAGI